MEPALPRFAGVQPGAFFPMAGLASMPGAAVIATDLQLMEQARLAAQQQFEAERTGMLEQHRLEAERRRQRIEELKTARVRREQEEAEREQGQLDCLCVADGAGIGVVRTVVSPFSSLMVAIFCRVVSLLSLSDQPPNCCVCF